MLVIITTQVRHRRLQRPGIWCLSCCVMSDLIVRPELLLFFAAFWLTYEVTLSCTMTSI